MWQLAWAAGLFDGEGTTCVLAAKRDKWMYPRLSMAQKNPEVLYKLQDLLGGKIYKSNTRNIYNWNLYKREDVIDALNKLWPFLSEQKKEQAIVAFERCGS
jgi:hypothetical protein